MNPEPRYQIIPLNIYALELMVYCGGVCCSFVLCVRLKLLFYGMNQETMMKLKQTSKANLVFAFFFFFSMIIFYLQSNYSYHVKNKQANKQKCDPIKISKNITVVLIYHFKSCLYFFS